MLFGVCVEHEHYIDFVYCETIIYVSWRIMGYSVYMNNILYDHAPKINGLLNLDRSDTHIHNIEAKRCKVNNDSATYLWHCCLGHIGVKRMKKLHADGIL